MIISYYFKPRCFNPLSHYKNKPMMQGVFMFLILNKRLTGSVGFGPLTPPTILNKRPFHENGRFRKVT